MMPQNPNTSGFMRVLDGIVKQPGRAQFANKLRGLEYDDSAAPCFQCSLALQKMPSSVRKRTQSLRVAYIGAWHRSHEARAP